MTTLFLKCRDFLRYIIPTLFDAFFLLNPPTAHKANSNIQHDASIHKRTACSPTTSISTGSSSGPSTSTSTDSPLPIISGAILALVLIGVLGWAMWLWADSIAWPILALTCWQEQNSGGKHTLLVICTTLKWLVEMASLRRLPWASQLLTYRCCAFPACKCSLLALHALVREVGRVQALTRTSENSELKRGWYSPCVELQHLTSFQYCYLILRS